MAYQQIEVRPVAGTIGAEIHGVNLAREQDAGAIAEIRKALLEHLVVFFRNQDITPAQQIAFAKRFGPLQVHPFMEHLEDYPEVLEVHTKAEDKRNFGGFWHSDITWAEKPALGSILYARKVPEHGGDTLWGNMYLAFERLSPGLQATLEGMRAVHSPYRAFGAGQRAAQWISTMKLANPAPDEEVVHPVVRTHPETGRKALYVNGDFTMRFESWTDEESAPLLNYLFQHLRDEEFTCRFQWAPGSVAFWDNRATQHRAIYDYRGQERLMHRVVIDGDRPA